MISEYRGQGIGRRIIETLVRESRRAGLRTLAVEFLGRMRQLGERTRKWDSSK